MTILRVHHVNINIPTGAEDDARAFYCGVLGFEEFPKPDELIKNGGFWLRLDNVDLHIGVQDDVPRYQNKAHIAYQVDDLSAWRMTLADAGVTVKENTAIPDFDRFEIRDPFGNRVEFVQVTD